MIVKQALRHMYEIGGDTVHLAANSVIEPFLVECDPRSPAFNTQLFKYILVFTDDFVKNLD